MFLLITCIYKSLCAIFYVPMPLKFPLLPIIVIRLDVYLSLHIWKSSKIIRDFLDLHTTRRVVGDWPLVRQGLRLFSQETYSKNENSLFLEILETRVQRPEQN